VAAKSEDFDLDEDLFDFEPVAPLRAELEDEEASLNDIFAAIQAEEELQATGTRAMLSLKSAAEPMADLEESEDDLYGDLDAPAPSAPAPSAPAPAAAAPDPAPIDEPEPPPPAALPSPPASAPAPEPPRVPEPAAKPLAGAAPASRGGGPFSRTALWILLAAMSLNGLIAIVLVSSTGRMRDEMQGISDDVETTIRDIRSEYWSQKALLLDETTPIAAPDPQNHPAFARALEEIEAGAYSAARQRLYALLAVIDRVDPAVRERVEARASYLIGHAWHLEALRQLEADEGLSEALEEGSE